MWWWLLILVALYVLLFFVIVPLVVPFMRKEPLPARIPKQLEDAIAQMESQSKTPYEYIKQCSHYLLSQNHGGRFATVIRVQSLFERDVRTLLSRRGFMHCTQLNHLMRILLVRSKFFTDDDIRLQHTFVNFNIHQYLQVRVAGQWYDVDLAGDWMGVPLGRHAWGFR